jgi:hypothetical protein
MAEPMTRKQIGQWSALRHMMRLRYYIAFKLKGGKKGAWPILFPTRRAAEKAMEVLPVFLNANGRFTSCCVERCRIALS